MANWTVGAVGSAVHGPGGLTYAAGIKEDESLANIDVGSGNMGTRLTYGSRGHERSRSQMASDTGLQEYEVDKYADLAVTAVSSILGVVFPVLWWLPAATTALQGTSKQVGGDYEQRTGDYGKIAQDTAVDLAVGYLGYKASGYGKQVKTAKTAEAASKAKRAKTTYTVAGSAVAAADAKAQGGTWKQAGVSVAASAIGTQIPAGKSGDLARAGVAAGGAGIVSDKEDRFENMAIAGGTSLVASSAGRYVGSRYGDSAGGVARLSVSRAGGQYRGYTRAQRLQRDRELANQPYSLASTILRPVRYGNGGGSRTSGGAAGGGATRSRIQYV